MKKKIIMFGKATDVTPADSNGKRYRFPFVVVEPTFSGSFTNEAVISEHFMVVEVARVVQEARHLTGEELKKVMFALGVNSLVPKVRNQAVAEEEEFLFYDPSTLGGQRPYDPSKIEDPEGAIVIVEMTEPPVAPRWAD